MYLSLFTALFLGKSLLLSRLLNDHIHVVIIVGHDAKIGQNGLSGDGSEARDEALLGPKADRKKKKPNLEFAGKEPHSSLALLSCTEYLIAHIHIPLQAYVILSARTRLCLR